MKYLFIFLLVGLPFWATAQSDFIVISDAGGVQFSGQELDTLNHITDGILDVIDNYLPGVAEDFKVYDFHFYLHNQNSFQTIDDILDLAVSSVESETPYYFIIFKEMSPTDFIKKVHIKFNIPSDSLPCIDPASFETTFEVLAGQHLPEVISFSNPSYLLDYFLLNSFQKSLSEGFCCSEYINSQNLVHASGQQRVVSCSVIDQAEVDDLVEFLQSDIGYNQGLENLLKVMFWYSGCSSTGWNPLHPQGIVPYCFWIGSPDPPEIPYLGGDLPFTFGVVDGLSVGIRNIVSGLLAAPETLQSIEGAVEAYTIYYVRCSGRKPNQATMKAAWHELQQITWSNATFQENFLAIISFLNSAEAEILKSASDLIYGEKSNEIWCAEKNQIRNSIDALAHYMTNYDSLEAYFGIIVSAFSDLWEDVNGLGNEERYYQGCYIMSAALEFIPITQTEFLADIASGFNKISDGVNGSKKLASRSMFIEKGADRVLNKIKATADYKALDGTLQNQFDLDFGGNYTSLLKISHFGGIKAWKKFVDDRLPAAFRRNVTNLKQRSLIDEYASSIANASSVRKGNFGEIGADLDLNAKGYESLMHNRIDDIDAPGHNGLDGVYRKNGQYYVVEGKYSGSASINAADPTTGLPRQMSDEWIATRDWSGVNLDQSVIDGIINNRNYQRILAKVAPDGTVAYRLIDSEGYAILGNIGIWTP